MTCVRCQRETKDFPKPSNRLCCGSCLHDLHTNFRTAEESKPERGV